MKKAALIGVTTLSLLSFNAYALSVGEMKVDSFLGEALKVSIDLNSISAKELSTLEVTLASRDLFEQAGISYPNNAEALSFEVKKGKGNKAKVLVNSRNAVSTPFVHLLLQINWSGGNILREYAVLIDPPGYEQPQLAASQALAPASKLGLAMDKVKSRNDSASLGKPHGKVKSGDSLSAIAAQYRPADVSIQQAWMAFYALNRAAFPENNLNRIKRGASINVPTHAQMLALSKKQAVREVRKLIKPVSAVAKQNNPDKKPGKPTLTVGLGAKTKTASTAKQAAVQTAASNNVGSADVQNSAGFGQMASILTELESFKEVVKQELISSRDENASFREALIAAKGENTVLNNRMAQLEAQLSRMSQLLELQTLAMENIGLNPNKNPIGKKPNAETSASIAAEQAKTAPVADAQDDTNLETPLAGDLVASAISAASKEDKSYIDAVHQDAATSIGLTDPNPVENQPQAAKPSVFASKPDMDPEEEKQIMLNDVRAALGNLQADFAGADSGADNAADSSLAPDGSADKSADVNITLKSKDLDYISSLNQRDEAQLKESSQRIADLEAALQAKVEAAKANQAVIETAPEPTPETISESAQTAEQSTKVDEAINTETVRVTAGDNTDSAGGTFMSRLMGTVNSVKESLMGLTSGLNSENLKYLGFAAAALLGLLALLGLRRRRSGTVEEESNSTAFVEDDSTSRAAEEDVEELHGSSLFDMTDESFMASEIVQNDSSLFAMDEDDADDSMMVEMGSDSSVLDDQSTMTQVVDVDPIAEAEVYLAYDRKEQAIKVLKDALVADPNQSKVVSKLLSLYQGTGNVEAFTSLFESSAEHIENDEDWNQIKAMAREFVPEHNMVQDDFEGSIPVLTDALETESLDKDVKPELSLDAMLLEDSDLEKLEDDALEDIGLDLDAKTSKGSESLSDEESDMLSLLDGDDDLTSEVEPLKETKAATDDALTLEDELDSAMEEVDQHDPETALALAKAYIELGEDNIAKDFLNDVVEADKGKFGKAAKKLLKGLS